MDEPTAEQVRGLLGHDAGGARGEAVSPASPGEVSAVCHALSEQSVHIALRSRPAKQADAPRGAVLLSLHRLAALRVEPAALVARAEAGVRVSDLLAGVAAEGLALRAGLDPALAGETRVGELVALGGIAPRGLCGVEAILPGGERVIAGGAMQRDVAGYDLVGALLGSRGRLAAVTAAWFRLQPAAARVEQRDADGPPVAGGVAQHGATASAAEAAIDELIRAAFDPAGTLVGG